MILNLSLSVPDKENIKESPSSSWAAAVIKSVWFSTTDISVGNPIK